MSRFKEYAIEIQEIEQEEFIAEILGLTYEELSETEWTLIEDRSNEGLLYSYIIQFDEAPNHILAKVKNLDKENQVWLSPNVFTEEEYNEDEDYNNYSYQSQLDAIIENKHYYDSFVNELSNLRKLNKLNVDSELEGIFYRQLYISAISTLETFLADTFINQTINNDQYFKNFVENYIEYGKETFKLKEIFEVYNGLKSKANKTMLDVIYHQLSKVKQMYSCTFGIDFLSIASLSKSVVIRHDLVHRNGRNKKGEDIIITSEMNNKLFVEIESFVEDISNKLELNRKTNQKNFLENFFGS